MFVDTTVLIYAASGDPRNLAKRRIAMDLLQTGPCALSLQVLNEFMWQSTNRRRADALTISEAFELVGVWRRFPILPLDLALFEAAYDVQRRTQYTWWDSLIVAAAIALGCDRLATEDLQHGRVIDSVRIVNPFRDIPAADVG